MLVVYGLDEINAFSKFARARLGPDAENSGLNELANMIEGSFWGLALMLFYTSAETLKSKLEPSPRVPSAIFPATETVDGRTQEGDAGADARSELDLLQNQPADHQKPDSTGKFSLWGLAGAFPFVLAFLIWKSGVTRSYNMALEVCFVMTLFTVWLLFLKNALLSLSKNDRYVIMYWRPVAVVVAVGVVVGLSYWFFDDFFEKPETESRSIDLFIAGVWAFSKIKERSTSPTHLQADSAVPRGT